MQGRECGALGGGGIAEAPSRSSWGVFGYKVGLNDHKWGLGVVVIVGL